MKSARSSPPDCKSSMMSRISQLSSRLQSPFWQQKFPHCREMCEKRWMFAGEPLNCQNLKPASRQSWNQLGLVQTILIWLSSPLMFHRSWRLWMRFTAPQSVLRWDRRTPTCHCIKSSWWQASCSWQVTARSRRRWRWSGYVRLIPKFAKSETWLQPVCPRRWRWHPCSKAVDSWASSLPNRSRIQNSAFALMRMRLRLPWRTKLCSAEYFTMLTVLQNNIRLI